MPKPKSGKETILAIARSMTPKDAMAVATTIMVQAGVVEPVAVALIEGLQKAVEQFTGAVAKALERKP